MGAKRAHLSQKGRKLEKRVSDKQKQKSILLVNETKLLT
ncbi:MAG: hypothetical protein ACI8RD_009822 [Bacillariaceae sp.]|jgi:hypothetical protein